MLLVEVMCEPHFERGVELSQEKEGMELVLGQGNGLSSTQKKGWVHFGNSELAMHRGREKIAERVKREGIPGAFNIMPWGKGIPEGPGHKTVGTWVYGANASSHSPPLEPINSSESTQAWLPEPTPGVCVSLKSNAPRSILCRAMAPTQTPPTLLHEPHSGCQTTPHQTVPVASVL